MTADHADPEEPSGIWARTTAPQSPFTFGQVATGLVVLVVGLVIAFGLPLLLG